MADPGGRDYGFTTTSAAARELGIHANTLRWYEAAGHLPPVDRTPGGYRRFTPSLIARARIVKRCFGVCWVVGPVRDMAREILILCRRDRFGDALRIARLLENQLAMETQMAEEALAIIAQWAESVPQNSRESTTASIHISAAARIAGISTDQIRGWEANQLIEIPRDAKTGYRVFNHSTIERLKVIRLCRRAGHSITAIRRLMQAVDAQGIVAVEDLATVSTTPSAHEQAMFNTFPSDVLLTTLENGIRDVRAIRQDLRWLANQEPC